MIISDKLNDVCHGYPNKVNKPTIVLYQHTECGTTIATAHILGFRCFVSLIFVAFLMASTFK